MSFFRKKRFRIILAVIAVVFALYWLLVNLLVSAALVPSFMRRLESFERITKKSYAEQVYTADLTSNSSVIWNLTNSWVRLAEKEKCEIVSEDGFSLKAMLFPADGAAPDASDANASTASDAIASTDPDATASTAPDADSGSGSGQTGSGNGQTLRGSKWAVLLHGYTGSKEAMYPIAFWYHRQGYHVLVPDLRCQGESDGDFIGMGWTDRRDVMQWINEVILARDPDAQVVLHGLSMGASCAVMVAGDPDAPACIRAVIADSAFTDAYSMFRYKIGDWFHLPAFPIVDSAIAAFRSCSSTAAVTGSFRPPWPMICGGPRAPTVTATSCLWKAQATRRLMRRIRRDISSGFVICWTKQLINDHDSALAISVAFSFFTLQIK